MEVRLQERPQARLIRIATGGAVAYSVAVPLMGLYSFISVGSAQGRTGYALVGTACYVPLQVWLVLSAARDVPVRRPGVALAALAAMTIGMVPVIGFGWFRTSYILAALALLLLRPPWSVLLFAAIVGAAAPLAFVFEQPDWALYYTLGVLLAAVPLAVVVWLTRAARQLQAARLALAQEAVVRERLRIDAELRRTVVGALDTIAARGERAAGLASTDPEASARELADLVRAARQTLADARRMVTGYQEVSLRAELQTAVTLLDAAGIRTRLELPPGPLPEAMDEAARAALRRDIARMLGGSTHGIRVTMTVSHPDGRIRLEPASAEPGPATTEVRVR